MFRLGNKLTDHSLNDANVAVQKSTYGSSEQSSPNVGSESYHDHAEHSSRAPNHENGLATNAVGQATPEHAHGSLGEREGGDEETGVERGILFVSDVKSLDKSPGVREDRSKSNWLGQTDNGCK